MTSSLPHIPALGLPPESVRAKPLFWAQIRKRWPVYAVGMGAVVGTNITEVMVPKCVQWTVDLLNGAKVPDYLWKETREGTFGLIVTILIATWIFQGLSRRYWRLTIGRETHLAESTLRVSIWERARFFPMERLQRDLSVGVLMNVGAGDARIARAIFGWLLIGITDVIFLGTFTVLAMLFISPSLTLAAIAIAPFVAFLLRKLQLREYEQHGVAQRELSEFNDLASQAVSTVKLQRLTQTAHLWVGKLLEAADSYRLRRFAVVKTSLQFFLTMGFAPLFSYAAIFILGINYVFNGHLSIGEFIAFQSYTLVLQGPLSELGTVMSDFQRALGSLERVAEVLRTEPAEGVVGGGATHVIITDPLIEVRNLNFAYGSRRVLQNFSLSVPEGGRIGITGPIGSGKSTLLSIVAGLERKYEGEVKLGGRDIKSYDHETLRDFIAVVPQKPFLFATTVRENVALGIKLTDVELWHYLEVVQIAEEIRRLPHQLDTMLGEWGINLSGGQKQRLTLARALAKKPKVLILDDCLSAVDTVTEEKILDHLDQSLVDTTIIWSAHRASTLRYCHSIIELK